MSVLKEDELIDSCISDLKNELIDIEWRIKDLEIERKTYENVISKLEDLKKDKDGV